MSSKAKRREVSIDEALTIIGEFGLSQKLQILLVRINLFIMMNIFCSCIGSSSLGFWLN